MRFLNKNEEKEVSGGAVFGYALIGFILVVLVSFIVFACVKTFNKTDNTEKSFNELTVSTEITQ